MKIIWAIDVDDDHDDFDNDHEFDDYDDARIYCSLFRNASCFVCCQHVDYEKQLDLIMTSPAKGRRLHSLLRRARIFPVRGLRGRATAQPAQIAPSLSGTKIILPSLNQGFPQKWVQKG